MYNNYGSYADALEIHSRLDFYKQLVEKQHEAIQELKHANKTKS
jgi:hypothetical protein